MIKTVVDILKEQGKVTPEQLEKCRQTFQEAGTTMERCLLDAKAISADDLAQAYAHLFGLEVIPKITEKMAETSLLAKVPLPFLRENVIMPISLDGKTVLVTSNPADFQPLDDLTLIFHGASTAVATRAAILEGINRYYPLEGTKEMIEELEEDDKGLAQAMELQDIEDKDIMTMAAEAPIIKLVNHMLYQAVKQDASDIHIEPFEKEVRVRYRIDGVMYDAFNPPKRIQAALVSRIKIMANLNIAEKRLPQDGRIQIKVADKPYDIRVSILPVAHGERVVMRLLDKSKTFSKLESLGFSNRDLKVINNAIEQPNGIVLVTGPTGSGKTSTLYAVLSKLNSPEVNIITVEDPVEYQMKGIGQVQVKEQVGLTFAAALRSILRQDPDVIMIGETRDQETAQIAIQASLTGHLVLSTIHTNNAPATITRLIDMGIEPFLIASTVVCIMAQRLVRKLCDHCKQKYQPTPEVLKSVGLTAEQAKKMTFYKAVGCEECLNTGYRGRLAIFEVMEMSSKMAQLTVDRADTTLLRQQALKDGMQLLLHDGLRKVAEGLTTIEEVLRVATAQDVVE